MHRFLLFAFLLLTACQTTPSSSFTAKQISVLKKTASFNQVMAGNWA